MPPAPGLNVVNDGAGDGIIGGTVDASGIGVHGVISRTATPHPAGFFGRGPAAVLGESWDRYEGMGVFGYSPDGWAGAFGLGLSNGVFGLSQSVGVVGAAIRTEGITTGVGVLGTGGVIGVQGSPDPWYAGSVQHLYGVVGSSDSDNGVGVEGDSESGTGVWGYSRTGVGVRASTNGDRAGWALLTDGDVLIQGNVYVSGGYPKSALVRVGDGSHRALYCVESPECWFEDFGRGRLVRGKARVRLDRTFAAVVRTGDYHVFLSPEGLSHGLYVSRRSRNGFEVREQHRGTSTVRFSYRIVARRKDVDAPRFKRVKLAELPKLPPRPPKPKQPRIPKAVLRLTKGRKPLRARPRTR